MKYNYCLHMKSIEIEQIRRTSYDYYHNENRPAKEVLEESIKKIKCPVCGFETEPYYMKFHMCEKA
jgi:hypothetical protein